MINAIDNSYQPNIDFVALSPLREKRARYKRLAQHVRFDLDRDNAIVTMEPVHQINQSCYRRFMMATAFKISEALSRLILSKNGA